MRMKPTQINESSLKDFESLKTKYGYNIGDELREFPSNILTPKLVLQDLAKNEKATKDLKGKSFWFLSYNSGHCFAHGTITSAYWRDAEDHQWGHDDVRATINVKLDSGSQRYYDSNTIDKIGLYTEPEMIRVLQFYYDKLGVQDRWDSIDQRDVQDLEDSIQSTINSTKKLVKSINTDEWIKDGTAEVRLYTYSSSKSFRIELDVVPKGKPFMSSSMFTVNYVPAGRDIRRCYGTFGCPNTAEEWLVDGKHKGVKSINLSKLKDDAKFMKQMFDEVGNKLDVDQLSKKIYNYFK